MKRKKQKEKKKRNVTTLLLDAATGGHPHLRARDPIRGFGLLQRALHRWLMFLGLNVFCSTIFPVRPEKEWVGVGQGATGVCASQQNNT